MNNSKYRGVVVPMVTPVTQDGQLDVDAVKKIINFFLNNCKIIALLPVLQSFKHSVTQRTIISF